MKIQLVAALSLLCALLLSASASAGDAPRRVTTVAGEVLQGVVLERSSAHLVLRLQDGKVIELLRDQIQTIEVLADQGAVGQPQDWAAQPETRRPRRDGPTDENEEDQPGVQLDGLDRIALKARLRSVEGGHALAVAPTVPSMAGGVVLMVFSPLLSGGPYGGYNSGQWVGTFVLGLSFASGSVFTAGAGAHMASVAAGMVEPSERFRMGLSMAIAGAGLFIVPLGLAYGSATGFLQATGAEPFATPWLVGSGLGLLIAGNSILASDALESRNAVARRIGWWEMTQHRRVRPQFAGAAIGPTPDGGIAGSVSIRF